MRDLSKGQKLRDSDLRTYRPTEGLTEKVNYRDSFTVSKNYLIGDKDNIRKCYGKGFNIFLYTFYMGHFTLNVRSKCLTSSIFFKFCGHSHMAIKWWHANFEKNWTTFKALLGHFTGVTFRVPKNGPKLPQFSKCSSYIKNALKIFFLYKNIAFDLFYLMNI